MFMLVKYSWIYILFVSFPKITTKLWKLNESIKLDWYIYIYMLKGKLKKNNSMLHSFTLENT